MSGRGLFAYVRWPAFIGATLALWQFGWVWALLFVVAVFGLLVRVYGISEQGADLGRRGAHPQRR